VGACCGTANVSMAAVFAMAVVLAWTSSPTNRNEPTAVVGLSDRHRRTVGTGVAAPPPGDSTLRQLWAGRVIPTRGASVRLGSRRDGAGDDRDPMRLRSG
jgi:hypothetical protein